MKTNSIKILGHIVLISLLLMRCKSEENQKFIKQIDVSEGNYALYINHKTLGEFMVTDQEAIIKNLDSLQIKVSWVNYLPGEGYRGYGITLFKDKELVKSISGGLFKKFEIGDLQQSAIPVKKHTFSGVKDVIKTKIDSLKANELAYLTNTPKLPNSDKEFSFRMYFPSIAIPMTQEVDSLGYEKTTSINGVDYKQWSQEGLYQFEAKWNKKIEDCIRSKHPKISNYNLNFNWQNMQNSHLFDVTSSYHDNLRTSEKGMLLLNNFMLYNLEVRVKADEKTAQLIHELDCSDCLTESDRNRPQLLAEMKQLVSQSNTPHLSVKNSEVGISNYQDSFKRSTKIYEQEYSIAWLEIAKKL